MTTAEFALVVSALAFTVSVASLWINNLKPFKLKATHDTPTFILYKITPEMSGNEEKLTWWIPSFDIGVSFYNNGRRPGEVLDIRIVAEVVEHTKSRKFIFYPKWVVDYNLFNQNNTERFIWIETAVQREWYPIILGPYSEKSLHIVLEGDRRDNKELGIMKFSFEIYASDKNQWLESADYTLRLSEDMFESKSSHTAFDKRLDKIRRIKGGD